MRIVVDTNESLRLLLDNRSLMREAVRLEQVVLQTSEPLIIELEAVSSRPKLQKWFSRVAARNLITVLRTRAEIVTPASETPPCRDPKDLPLIGTALAG